MAFWEDFALPAGVLGPRDLAPLMRADSDLVSDMGTPGGDCSWRVFGDFGIGNRKLLEMRVDIVFD